MDEESRPPSLPKVKKGRKSRSPKVKSATADPRPATAILAVTAKYEAQQSEQPITQLDKLANSPSADSSGRVLNDLQVHSNSNSHLDSRTDFDTTGATAMTTARSNDNLLMPPPAQPDAEQAADSMGNQEKKLEAEGPQEHELIVDGFSIFCYDSEQTVAVSGLFVIVIINIIVVLIIFLYYY